MFKKILSFVVIAIAFATSCSEVSAQSVDSVRIDSIKFNGTSCQVYFKYWNLSAPDSLQVRYGISPSTNGYDTGLIPVSAGTVATSIGFNVPSFNTSYNLRVVFKSGIDSPIETATSGSAGGFCSVSVGASNTSLCIGQSTTLTAAMSGVGNYSYTWTPGNLSGSSVTVTPTTTTTYTVTGTDGVGCSDFKSVVVTVGVGGNITVLQDTSICTGQPVTLSVSSTQSVSSYQWSNGATTPSITVTPTTTTSYVATVNYTSGCSSSKEVLVTVKNSPAQIWTDEDTVCLNSLSNISVWGYPWNIGTFSPNISGGIFDHITAGAGRHTLKYISNEAGCVSEDSTYVWVMSSPQITNWSYDQSGNLILNGSFPYQIQIVVNSNIHTPVVQNTSQAIFSNLSLIQGQLIIVKSVGGGDCFSTFYITATHADEALDYEIITVFPNPCKDILNIKATSIVGEILKIFNTHGQEVRTVSLEGETSVDMSGLPSGVYYARLGTSNVVKILRE